MSGTGSVGINFVTALPTTANVGAHRIHTSNGLLQGYNGTTWVQYGAGGGGAAISASGNSVSSGTVVFSNSNGISFGMSGSTITATVVPGAAAGIAAIGASSQTATSGTIVLSNSNGLTFGMSGSTRITGSHDGIRSISAGTTNVLGPSIVLSNSHNVSFGGNGSTITASASYSQSTSPAAIAANGSTITNGTVVLSNSNGVSFGANGSTVTASVAAGATATGNLGALAAGSQTATSGSVAFIDSNGISFGMSASTRITASYTVPSTAGLISAINVSAGTTSTNASAVVFSNANGVSFGLNGATITASASGGGGGGGWTLSTFEPAPFVANTGTAAISLSSNTSAAMMLFPMQLAAPVAAELMGIVVSMSMTTGGASSFRQSGTLRWGLYTRPTGASSTQLNLLGSDSLSYGVTYSASSISISQVTTTNYGPSYGYGLTNSAGLNISSGYTGLKLLNIGIGSTLTAGQYWFGLHHRNSSSSFNSGIRLSLYGSAYTLTGLAPMGSFSSAYSTGTNVHGGLGGNLYLGLGSYSVAGLTSLPGTISISQITQAGVNLVPYWRLSTRVT